MHSDKGQMLSGKLVSIIIMALTMAAILGLWSATKGGFDSIDHKECRSSIASAHGIKLEIDGPLGTSGGVSAPIKCPVVVVQEFPEEDVTENKDVARHVLNKMDLAWWATWSNQVPNTFKDYWKKNNVCKKLYELWVDPNKIVGEITAEEMKVYAGTIPFAVGENNEEITFDTKMLITQGKAYFALEGPNNAQSFKGGDVLEIYVLGPQKDVGNSIILTNYQGSEGDKKAFINKLIEDERAGNIEDGIQCGDLQS